MKLMPALEHEIGRLHPGQAKAAAGVRADGLVARPHDHCTVGRAQGQPAFARGRTVMADRAADHYICTGGQVYELMVGHDRFLADLRPLVFGKLRLKSALVCHPYDICTALLLEAAGGVVEGIDGKPLNAPLDTTSPVAWVGYANPTLAKAIRPALRRAMGL